MIRVENIYRHIGGIVAFLFAIGVALFFTFVPLAKSPLPEEWFDTVNWIVFVILFYLWLLSILFVFVTQALGFQIKKSNWASLIIWLITFGWLILFDLSAYKQPRP